MYRLNSDLSDSMKSTLLFDLTLLTGGVEINSSLTEFTPRVISYKTQ